MARTVIDTTPQEDAIIAPNMGIKLNLRNADGSLRNATQAEVKQFLIDHLRLTIKEVRQAVAAQAGKDSIPADGGIAPT